MNINIMMVAAIIQLMLLFILIVLLIKNNSLRLKYKKQTITLCAIYRSMPDMVLCKDINGAYVSCNPSFEKFAGCSEAELIGKTTSSINGLSRRIPDDVEQTDNRVLKEGATLKIRERLTFPDGSSKFIETIKAPLINDEKIIGLIGIVRDISELKQLLEDADKANRLKNISITSMEKILNSLDSMIYVSDTNTGEILFINDIMKKHYNIDGDCTGQLCYKVLQKDRDRICDFCPCFQLDKEPDNAVIWEERSSLTGRIYRNVDRYIDWPNGGIVHMQHSADMTELIAAKEFAEQSSRYKSAFLANMSHEIRTPMNAILGIAEIQLQNKTLSPDNEEAFGKIYESGELLLNIINDILDLSKIEAGKLELVPVNYNISSLINDTAQLNCLRYDSKPITFSLHIDENTPYNLSGDELRIKQVLNNVLSNAFKYTAEGKVDLSVSFIPKTQDENVTLVFRISDTGQGMTEKQINKIFDEYVRFNMEANRTTIGAGLGMNITKHLVDLMKGNITVESKLGKGSVFTVYIPQKQMGQDVCGRDLSEKLRNFRFQSAAITKKTQFLREYMPYGSVLIFDDVESNIYVTKGMLMPYGLKIDSAESGFEAIDKIKNGNVYDIVFMDHMMPKMDGIETVKILRNMGYKHYIVALTANALAGQAEMFLNNGFDGFVSKPIDSRELNMVLNDFIRNKKPPETVEAARREYLQKKLKNSAVCAEKKINTSELEKFFVRDAENAVKMMKNIFVYKNGSDDICDVTDIESFIITVHGIKSALANIGEEKLSDIALKLEKAGREKNLKFIIAETPALINKLQSLIAEFKTIKQNSDIAASEEDLNLLREKLRDVKSACSKLDKKTAKVVMNDLKQKSWPDNINTVLEEITVQLLHSDFEEAAAAVDSFIPSV